MNAMTWIYLPVAVSFGAFVVYGGIVMPAREIADSVRHRRRTRPQDGGAARHGKAAA
ncbi:hypothetical protein [Actinomadura sp. NBRC 104425]|uniref:hypothetical protein n=1 Tax=Actinomadura sp. NBRC 104425 TaxID=3032204 RepID=UPI002554DA12|nr:hypothetical protein [Actinomadura sp. NBRC 104425]